MKKISATSTEGTEGTPHAPLSLPKRLLELAQWPDVLSIRGLQAALLDAATALSETGRRYIDDDFLAQIMDSRYSNDWVGCALRWQLNDEAQVKFQEWLALSPLATTGRQFPICDDHKNAEWNQPEILDCVLCRVFYLEAQESLLEEWQQRAMRAEADIAEVKRPLSEQMERLNQTVVRLNGELEAARSTRIRLLVPR